MSLIPFSELVHMVRHYAQAKTGGIVSIGGMWLMVPWIGSALWETEQQVKQELASLEQRAEERGDDEGEEEELTPEILREMPAEMAVYYFKSRKTRLAEKTRKVEQMNARLKWWFDQLQQKRAAVTGDADAVKSFNAQVTAYSTYNALTKEANEELLAMQAAQVRR